MSLSMEALQSENKFKNNQPDKIAVILHPELSINPVNRQNSEYDVYSTSDRIKTTLQNALSAVKNVLSSATTKLLPSCQSNARMIRDDDDCTNIIAAEEVNEHGEITVHFATIASCDFYSFKSFAILMNL